MVRRFCSVCLCLSWAVAVALVPGTASALAVAGPTVKSFSRWSESQ